MKKFGAFVLSSPACGREKNTVRALIIEGLGAEQLHFIYSPNQITQIKSKAGNGFGFLL